MNKKILALIIAGCSLTALNSCGTKNSVESNEVNEISSAAEEIKTEQKTEAHTEPETKAPTEPKTEAPTEPETEAPTEPETEAPTESETEEPKELLPLSEVKCVGKGNEAGFMCLYFSDDSITIDGVYEWEGGSEVTIPETAGSYRVRGLDLSGMAMGAGSLGWEDIKTVNVPESFKYYSLDEEISFETAQSYFANSGMTLAVE